MATTANTAAARSPRSTASTIVTREVRGHHTLIIDGCALSKKIPSHHTLSSRTFEAAGYHWRIRYHPGAAGAAAAAAWWGLLLRRQPCISLYLELDGAHERVDHPVEVTFSLLDRDDNPVPRHTRVAGVFVFDSGESSSSRCHGLDDFIRWSDLEESGCLAGDRFAVRCDVAVIKDWAEDAAAPAVPPSDLHEHLYDLLWTKQGTDATVTVAGETFHVHRWLLAARSPVFDADLRAAAATDDASVHLEVDGVEPRVFRAALRFLYTDSLPRVREGGDAVAMARGLLAVAHRYELERLKPMCEEMLRERIGVDTVAGTLAAAEKYGCKQLKNACVEFMTYPGNMKAVIETEGFEKIKAEYPSLLMELVMKQLVA